MIHLIYYIFGITSHGIFYHEYQQLIIDYPNIRSMLSHRHRNWEQFPTVLLVGGTVLFSTVDISIPYILEYFRVYIIRNYGIYGGENPWWISFALDIPWWIPFVMSACILAMMYPRVGVPVVRSWVGDPLSRRAIILQTVVGIPVVLTVVSLIEFGLFLPIQIVHLGALRPQYIILDLKLTTFPAVALGVCGGLVGTWMHHYIRS